MTTIPLSTSPLALLFMRRALLVLLSILFVLYLGDLSWFQIRSHIPTFGAATGSIHRIRLLAIPGKAGKTEYAVDAVHPEEDVPCVRALFPHAGQRPCWYVARHANDPIPM